MTNEEDPSRADSAGPPESSTVSHPDDRTLECTLCPFESFEYRHDEDAYVAVFDAAAVDPSTAVVGAVSTVSDTDPRTLEPLYVRIDPDALDTLFAPGRDGDGDLHAMFTMDGFEVTVSRRADTVIRLRESSGPVDAEA